MNSNELRKKYVRNEKLGKTGGKSKKERAGSEKSSEPALSMSVKTAIGGDGKVRTKRPFRELIGRYLSECR